MTDYLTSPRVGQWGRSADAMNSGPLLGSKSREFTQFGDQALRPIQTGGKYLFVRLGADFFSKLIGAGGHEFIMSA